MNERECLRILGLPADATPEQVRQAYLDLVRVWHPDRFQQDSRLQQVAQERLCEINEAYSQLKDRPAPHSAASAAPTPTPEAQPQAPRFDIPSRPPNSNRRGVALTAMMAILCTALIAGGVKFVQLYPSLPGPGDSTPAPDAQRTTVKPRPRALRTGAELIAGVRSPAPGYLHVANRTNLEAIAKVVSDQTAVRAVYIRPHENVLIRSIRIGVYELHVDLGTDLDMEHLSFRNNQSVAEPLGPFEFHEITSENGISGSHYSVALNLR